MNIKPLGDRLLVKPAKEEETTASGVVIPETLDREKKMEGEIIDIGRGEEVLKLGLSVGQKVLFKKWGGEEVKSDGENYKILSHEDIVALIE